MTIKLESSNIFKKMLQHFSSTSLVIFVNILQNVAIFLVPTFFGGLF
jgi:hypothetical protein